MNNKQREIEADIKRQMLALSAQMDALNIWKATGYNSEICTPALHDWKRTSDFSWEIDKYHTVIEEESITIRLECFVCGIQATRYYNFSDEVITDKWTDFREGGEEE